MGDAQAPFRHFASSASQAQRRCHAVCHWPRRKVVAALDAKATADAEVAEGGAGRSRRPGGASHNLGTCRQSAQARDGVCNTYGQTHGQPLHLGRQPVSSAGTENPTLTFVALSLRQADDIATQLARRDP
ncbi:MAG: hypothetical protein ACLPJH_09550 [Myxococcaceae bacterium]